MKTLDDLLNTVKSTVLQHTTQQQQGGFDPSRLIQNIEDLFGQHRAAQQQPGSKIRPASQDPLGDPADGAKGRVKPASEDPYGDPADGRH